MLELAFVSWIERNASNTAYVKLRNAVTRGHLQLMLNIKLRSGSEAQYLTAIFNSDVLPPVRQGGALVEFDAELGQKVLGSA